MRVLVDTCVIVDALQDRKPFSENAKIIFNVSLAHQTCCNNLKFAPDD